MDTPKKSNRDYRREELASQLAAGRITKRHHDEQIDRMNYKNKDSLKLGPSYLRAQYKRAAKLLAEGKIDQAEHDDRRATYAQAAREIHGIDLANES